MRILIRDETSSAESFSSTDAASACIGSGTGVSGSRITTAGVSIVITSGIVGPQKVTPASVICATGIVSVRTLQTSPATTATLSGSPVMWNWEAHGAGQHVTFQGPSLGCVTVQSGPLVSGILSGNVITFQGTNSDSSGGRCAPPSDGPVSVRYTYL